MDIEDVPVVGKIDKRLKSLIFNLVLLAVIAIVLGVLIPFYPAVLDWLVAILFLAAAVILLDIARHINAVRTKYTKWFE